MKKISYVIFSALMLLAVQVMAQTPVHYLSKEPAENKTMTAAQTDVYSPVPKIVTPGKTCGAAPSDAIILFDGNNLDQWVSADGGPAQWTVAGGAVTVKPGSGEIGPGSLLATVSCI